MLDTLASTDLDILWVRQLRWGRPHHSVEGDSGFIAYISWACIRCR